MGSISLFLLLSQRIRPTPVQRNVLRDLSSASRLTSQSYVTLRSRILLYKVVVIVGQIIAIQETA